MKLELSFLHPATCPGSHSPSQPQSMSLNRDVDDVGCARPPTSSCSGSISENWDFASVQELIPRFRARPAVCISHWLPCVADPAGLEEKKRRINGGPSALQSAGVTGSLGLLVAWVTFTSAVCLTSSL